MLLVDLEPLVWALQVHLAILDVQGRRNTTLETVDSGRNSGVKSTWIAISAQDTVWRQHDIA